MVKKKDDYNSYMRVYMLRRYHQKTQEAIESLGGKCSKCGSKKHLEIDHIDPTQKSFDLSKMWSTTEEKRQKELKKCQVLCHSCHERKHHNGKYEHGTLSSYRYCRCDECKKAKSDYNKAYKKHHG